MQLNKRHELQRNLWSCSEDKKDCEPRKGLSANEESRCLNRLIQSFKNHTHTHTHTHTALRKSCNFIQMCKHATTSQNISIRRNTLPLQKRCRYKNTNVPHAETSSATWQHVHHLENIQQLDNTSFREHSATWGDMAAFTKSCRNDAVVFWASCSVWFLQLLVNAAHVSSSCWMFSKCCTCCQVAENVSSCVQEEEEE